MRKVDCLRKKRLAATMNYSKISQLEKEYGSAFFILDLDQLQKKLSSLHQRLFTVLPEG